MFLADANFGIFERDVEIAEKVAELKASYGYPNCCPTNYAKNTMKHLKKIVEIARRRRDPHPRPALAAVDGRPRR